MNQVDQYVEICLTDHLTHSPSNSVLGVPPMTTNQPLQQSPTRNTFTSTEATPLSTMENQHEREKGK